MESTATILRAWPTTRPSQPKPEIMLQTEQMAGVWANFAAVSHSEHEFTIDFVRMDGTAPPPGPWDRGRARLDVAALRHAADRRAQAELERLRAEGAAEGGVRGR